MEQDEKIDMVENMQKFGRGFVQALARAILHADAIKLKKIEDAFPEIIKKYKK